MAYTSTTRATLRGRVREQLIPTFWEDAELNAHINEAIRVWNVLTGYFQDKTVSQIVTGNIDGQSITTSIAPDCIAPLRFVDQSSRITWDAIALNEISTLNVEWLNDIGTPAAWIPIGLDRFYIYPPDTSQPIKIDYLALAIIPSIDADFIQVGEEDLPAIIDYIVFIAHIKEGGAELQTVIPLFQNFLRQVAKYNSKISKTVVFNKFLGMPMGGQASTRPQELESQSGRG